jgi:pyruvate dehydrogenase E2 component (dihydrolipoamide acetyltransferase)
MIEVLVNAGDELSAEDSIITLESDKASMEIPTPVAGKVIDINVTLGPCHLMSQFAWPTFQKRS